METISSTEDIRQPGFWKACFAELLGTGVLVIFACGTCLHATDDSAVLTIALGFGFSVATMVGTIGHVSGGHINPAVTLAFFSVRRISTVRCLFYIISQCVGAITGAGILYAIIPKVNRGTLCTSVLGPEVSLGQGFSIELIITFSFVLSIFALVDTERTDVAGSVPMAVGFSIALCHLLAVPYTGAAMNPARLLGPAVVSGIWDDHWVYWLGDLVGGVLAAFLYEWLFSVSSSPRKIRSFFTAGYHGDQEQGKRTNSINVVS